MRAWGLCPPSAPLACARSQRFLTFPVHPTRLARCARVDGAEGTVAPQRPLPLRFPGSLRRLGDL